MRDKTNLYAYTHKYKKHNKHNKYNKHHIETEDGVFGDRRTAPSLHDITLKMRKMYDAVAGSFSSFNDPSKPFTAINYRRIHNGWKNKKNGRRGMNRMNRMKRMIGGTDTPCINENTQSVGTVYEMVADNIGDNIKSATVKISRTGKPNFEEFTAELSADDAEKAQAAAAAAEVERAAAAAAEVERLAAEAAAAAERKRVQDAAAAAAAAAGHESEDTLLLKAAALASIATAMAIAAENETTELLLKAAALASIATAMAMAIGPGETGFDYSQYNNRDFKVTRSSGVIEDGWKLVVPHSFEITNHGIKLTKGGIFKNVPIEHLMEDNLWFR